MKTKFETHLWQRSNNTLLRGEPHRIGWVDYNSEVVAFPLWNLSGQLIGYQTYRWKFDKVRNTDDPRLQRYFTRLPKGVEGVYGLHLVPEGYLGPIYLVEGIWEAVCGHSIGLMCIAVLGCDPKGLKNWIWSLPNQVISLTQPDSAGKKLRKYGKDGNIELIGDLDDCIRGDNIPDELRRRIGG